MSVDRASRQLTLEVIHPTLSPKAYPVEGIPDTG